MHTDSLIELFKFEMEKNGHHPYSQEMTDGVDALEAAIAVMGGAPLCGSGAKAENAGSRKAQRPLSGSNPDTSHPNTSEIPVVEKMCLAAWGTESNLDKTTQVSIMEDALDAIKEDLDIAGYKRGFQDCERMVKEESWRFKSPEPVSVAQVANNLSEGFRDMPGGLQLQIKLNIQNVLRAAGFPYVD